MGRPWMCLSGGHPGGRASLGSGRQMDGGTERHLYGSVSQECIPSGSVFSFRFLRRVLWMSSSERSPKILSSGL